jgi:glycosyltransferase involved in cell wall biosynthesis
VTPTSTGSIEQLVWLLTEELVRRGHEVTLYATGDSETSARLKATYPRGYGDDPDLWNWQLHETMHVASAFEQAYDFDVIHSHDYHYALPFTRLTGTPVVHSYHVIPDDDVARLYARYREASVVAISRYQEGFFRASSNITVIHHGIDIDAFPFRAAPGDYLLFLGRILPGKGVVQAVRLARQAGMRLLIAGPKSDGDDYFRSGVAPLVDGRDVVYQGPVTVSERNPLLAGAAALLYPILAPEPFGLVLIEAMACGTPVAAFGRGAVPEIVENGVTGYFADDLASLAALIPAVLALDRAHVRDAAAQRFDHRQMVDRYVTVYERLSQTRRRRWA